jgi:hypothetical protein
VSILDRRFWIMDKELDYTEPPYVGVLPYTSFSTGVGRPVYPDLVDDVLSNEDDLRGSRMLWINYRTNLINGTLLKIKSANQRIENRTKNSKKVTTAR